MKQVRSSLTRIKNKIFEKLPENGEIFGYAGISRQLMLEGIDECAGLVDGLEGKRETLDVIILKREFNELSKSCLDFLNSLPRENQEAEFNQFLKWIAEIRRIINTTFLLVVKESLRPEETINAIRAALDEIIPNNSKLIEEQVKSEDKVKKINEYFESAEKASGELANSSKDAKNAFTEATNLQKQISDLASNSAKWASEISKNEKSIANQAETIQKNELTLEGQKAAVEKTKAEIEKNASALVEQIEKNKGFQEQIQLTIGDANRSSMAGSFKSRKDELIGPLAGAEKMLVLVLVLFGGAAFALVFPYLGETKFEYLEVLVKLPILTPFIWLAWFYTRKVGHLTQVQEDYAFKYAAAMAFEGYDKNCGDNTELSKSLLALSIQNMGENPIRLYGKEVHSGPISEYLKTIGDALKSIPIPGFGKKD